MARFLVRLVAAYERDARPYCAREIQQTPHAEKASSDASYLVHWGLLRRPEDDRYIPTELGLQWVRGETTVMSHALTYAGGSRGLTGERITIADALGTAFDPDGLRAS